MFRANVPHLRYSKMNSVKSYVWLSCAYVYLCAVHNMGLWVYRERGQVINRYYIQTVYTMIATFWMYKVAVMRLSSIELRLCKRTPLLLQMGVITEAIVVMPTAAVLLAFPLCWFGLEGRQAGKWIGRHGHVAKCWVWKPASGMGRQHTGKHQPRIMQR